MTKRPSSAELVAGAGRYFLGKFEQLSDNPAKALTYISIVFGAFWAIDFILAHTVPSALREFGALDLFNLAAVALSVLMIWLCRRDMDPERLTDIGLAFEVAAALLIAVSDPTTTVTGDAPVLGVTYVCLWVGMFPLCMSSTLRKSVLASLLAASTEPLVYLIRRAGGDPALSTGTLLALFLPTFLAAGVSFYPIYLRNKVRRDLEQARRMGSYELVDLLGEGGMGQVWRARHALLARSAAIKLIKSQRLHAGSDGDVQKALMRFHREAESTARLQSPHTVVLYDFGCTADNTFYYVMELLSGLDLNTLVKRFGPIPVERAVYLLQQACHSLQEAHREGMVHRDIKPANIFICKLGLDHDFVKVLDFGLVKDQKTRAEDDISLTVEGTITGTPAFMAPECISGERPADARSDIYALGCVAYWMVTGRLVFEGTTTMEMLSQHLQSQPVPPSKRTEMEVPAAYDEVVLACLMKDPERRIQSVEELDARLAAIPVANPWSRERAREWWQNCVPLMALTARPAEQTETCRD